MKYRDSGNPTPNEDNGGICTDAYDCCSFNRSYRCIEAVVCPNMNACCIAAVLSLSLFPTTIPVPASMISIVTLSFLSQQVMYTGVGVGDVVDDDDDVIV